MIIEKTIIKDKEGRVIYEKVAEYDERTGKRRTISEKGKKGGKINAISKS